MNNELPNEAGYYWHMNGHGLWEIAEVKLDVASMIAETMSGRELFGGEAGYFGERIPFPDEGTEG